jgi:predicted TIM-barrel fold metal-dependent hydrolase
MWIAACATPALTSTRIAPSAAHTVTPPPAPVALTAPQAVSPAPTTRQTTTDTLIIHDAHLHFSADSQAAYTLDQIIAVMDGAGIQRALFSSTPNDGTVQLYQKIPQRIIPSLRPYRTRADISTWFNDSTIVPFVEQELKRGIYRAIGEFHANGDQAKTPVMKKIVEIAVANNLYLHAHSDAAAIEALFAHNPKVRVIWAHAGMSESVDTLSKMADRYPNLWIELSYRPDIAYNNKLDSSWRALFLRHPNRFLYGTDTWVQERWTQLPALATWARSWLAELPPDVTQRIATKNFEGLFEEQ